MRDGRVRRALPRIRAGVVYATPDLRGLQISVGAYDPATIDNAQLDRAPLPRVEGEVKFDLKNVVRLFASGFWQVLEGTVTAMTAGGTPYAKNLHVDAWGAQAGAMLSLGPIMLGGAAYEGAGFSPITYIDESVMAADSAGVLRNSRGAFGLGAILINALSLKIAGGVGVWHLDKNRDDGGAISASGAPANPQLIKQNLGETIGLYQSTGPIRFALEYFRAQHTWYDRGVPSPTDPTMAIGDDHAASDRELHQRRHDRDLVTHARDNQRRPHDIERSPSLRGRGRSPRRNLGCRMRQRHAG